VDNQRQIRDELRDPAKSLHAEIPEVMSGFAAMSSAAFRDGNLPQKTKELAALAIAISKECDGCIVAHVRNVVRLGVTRSELAELIGVAIVMNGGPGTVWGPRALRAYDEMVAERAAGPNS
jgi:AhpD family alkylhydroperoxidase